MARELSCDFTVRISECDPRGHIRPGALMVEMQELAEAHSASLGLSRASMIESGIVWVLYRQSSVMHAYPSFGRQVRLTTWPGAIAGPIFPRYFILEDALSGERLGEVTSSWILMNIHTRRPMRPSALPGAVPPNVDRQPPLPLPEMLRIEDARPLLERTVQYSDLDVNGHMNNTRYIDWICDALPREALLEKGLAAWQINYISEAKPGDALVLRAREDGAATLVQGLRAVDERLVFEARVALAAQK